MNQSNFKVVPWLMFTSAGMCDKIDCETISYIQAYCYAILFLHLSN